MYLNLWHPKSNNNLSKLTATEKKYLTLMANDQLSEYEYMYMKLIFELQCLCTTLQTKLSSQLEAGHIVSS